MSNSIYNRDVIRISKGDELYPKNIEDIMRQKAPKHLEAVGNINLLNEISIGFCGSRDSSDEGIEVTRDITEQSTNNDITIVSGNARGVDIAAHQTALKTSGNTIFVLPEGLGNFRIRKSLEQVWDWEKVLVISQFDFDNKWMNYRAIERNLLILSLVRVMIVVEAGTTGGSLSAGKEALNRNLPLFVVDGLPDAGGNKILFSMHAEKIIKDSNTQKMHLDELIAATAEEYNPLQSCMAV